VEYRVDEPWKRALVFTGWGMLIGFFVAILPGGLGVIDMIFLILYGAFGFLQGMKEK
jgi:uncharacterized membrane protein YbhN (UPF0104 family)